jgi:wobble nucleotide-excising tRNase
VEATARTYNEAVSVLNERIEGRRREIGEVDPASAQARLNLLLNVKRRHEPDVVALCSRHSVACAQWSDLDRTTKSHQAQVRKAGDASAKQYAGAVREYLKRFNCSFDLVIEKPDLKASGKPRMTYLIRINDEDVDPVAPGPSSAVPCFRNTLSDGDITTLAFALFLAQLDEVPNLQDRTIVFDDPLPSQDGHRRQQTVQELVRLGSKAGQLIVMSHDRMFLRQVWDALADRRQQQEVSALHFARSGVDSDVQPWDIPSQTDMAWFGDYDVVDRYAARDQAGTNLRNIAGTIRRVLEYYLRIMAPNELPPDTTLGQIISLIRGAAAGSRLADFGPVLTELEDINAALVDSAHAEGYEPKASIDDTQLSGIARRAVALMRGWAPRAA